MSDELRLLPACLAGHVRLTGVALGLGTALSLGLGLWASRSRAVRGLALGTASVVQTIPGLALLAIMVPLLGRIGFLPAIVALVLYSMLPVLRNTVVGIDEVPAEIVEAARGVGMTDGQMLMRVQLPLAAPVILAGVRTAAAWTVGMATLATPVGATSLGNFIFRGLQTRDSTAILIGCAAAAGLALAIDAALRGVEASLRRRRRAGALLSGGLLLLGLTVLALPAGGGGNDGAAAVRIGAKPFTEQYILAELLALQVERGTGRPTRTIANLGSTVAFDALRFDQIDAYVDYSGTLWTTVLGRSDSPPPAPELLALLRRELLKRWGVRLVAPLGFENAYGLAMQRDRAAALGLATIGDLRARAPELTLGADMEFLGRDEYRDLDRRHGIRFREARPMDAALMYQALAAGQVDVISAYTTEGKIRAYDLVILEDDVDAFPPYDAVILAAPGCDRSVVETLRGLAGSIDDDAMLQANWSVDELKRPAREVATGLLPSPSR